LATVVEQCGNPTTPSRSESASSGIESQYEERITMERRLAIVLATLLGSFSALWIINFKVVAIGRALMMLR
jgi:hypothetical protein